MTTEVIKTTYREAMRAIPQVPGIIAAARRVVTGHD